MSEGKANAINVVYTVDIRGPGAMPFRDQLIASIASIRKVTLESKDFVHIRVLHAGIDGALVARLAALADGDHVKISFKEVPMELYARWEKWTKGRPQAGVREWSAIVYARLWIPLIYQDMKRCIYLDADTFVRSPLRPLYEYNLEGKPVAMAMGCIPEYGFNSGVLVIDCEMMREHEQEEYNTMCARADKEAVRYFLPDQTLMNRHFAGRIAVLPPAWNFPPKAGAKPTMEAAHASIWHFYNGGTKPLREPLDEFTAALHEWRGLLEYTYENYDDPGCGESSEGMTEQNE